MIEIKDLNFHYKDSNFNLNIPEFKVSKGEKIAIIGPSGSGKTTLLNLVSGILLPHQGSVKIEDTLISGLSDNLRRDFRINHIGFVFQEFELLDYLNVKDNILHPYRITKSLKLNKSIRERAEELVVNLGIQDKLNRSVSKLSQGEKQRVAICRAMLTKPKIILADEATGNLDPDNKLKILKQLFNSAEKEDATLLAVTHDVELTTHFDRVVDFKTWIN